jgi:hypothetical protein
MSNSSRGTALGRRSGTVTVIEEPVRRSAARNSQIAFWVTWAGTGLLAATITSSIWRPVIGLFAGALIGLVLGTVTAALVLAWPVLRVLWWWATEILTAASLITGWIELADHTSLALRLIIVAAAAGTPAAVRPARHRLRALCWCLITRHRLRTCFSDFIITNRYGSLPLILWARPTPVGERVWIWLRPGLALKDLQDRLDQIAVTCWGSAATVEPASRTNSAILRLNIKRRDGLTGTVKVPLAGLAALGRTRPPATPAPSPAPAALDLPDIAADDVTPIRPKRTGGSPPAAPAAAPAAAGPASDDISDWI